MWVIIAVSPRARSAWLESLSSHRWLAYPRGGVQTQQGVSDHRAIVAAAPRGCGSPSEPNIDVLVFFLVFFLVICYIPVFLYANG